MSLGTDPNAILAQMEKILSSRLFAQSGQLSRLLRFSVTEAVARNLDKLKESVLGVEVFGREPGFDTRAENVVRVAESRLRERLREYYEGEGAADPVLILLEKGSYIPQFSIRPVEVKPPAKPPSRVRLFQRAVMGLGLILLLATFSWLMFRGTRHTETGFRVVPLTTYPGVEEYPVFSPDGSRVAFTWTGEKQDQVNVYVKVIGTEAPLRLTNTRDPECCLAWSPDGRWISFLRCPAGAQCPPGNGRQDVIVVPALGGPEHHAGTIYPGVNTPYPPQTWTPDSKALIVSDKNSPSEGYSLMLLSTETGEKRQLTPAGSGDSAPAVSPDGKTLAFVRALGNLDNGLFVVPLTDNWAQQGTPRLLVHGNESLEDPMWSPDSGFLYFTSPATSRHPTRSLWRVAVSGKGEAQRVAEAGEIGREVALSRQGDRLAYTDAQENTSIWRLDLSSPGRQPERLISSTRADYNPRFSPDGKRIAFGSNRSGSAEIWVSDSDGRNPVQLTSIGRAVTGNPRWSPDGTLLAFDSTDTGIHVMGADGSHPRMLTPGPPNASTPSWSGDGRWIYFASDLTGELQVWKVPASGGNPVQLTKQGGHSGFESADGRFFYYAKSPVATSLWRVPVAGGEETMVAPSLLTRTHIATTNEGVYFVEKPAPDRSKTVRFLRFKTGAIETVTKLDQELDIGLSVSPDRHWMLFSAVEVQRGDLLMIEGLKKLSPL